MKLSLAQVNSPLRPASVARHAPTSRVSPPPPPPPLPSLAPPARPPPASSPGAAAARRFAAASGRSKFSVTGCSTPFWSLMFSVTTSPAAWSRASNGAC